MGKHKLDEMFCFKAGLLRYDLMPIAFNIIR
jgi:hypothetical protein